MQRRSSDSFDIDYELPDEVVGVLQAQFLRFGDFIRLFGISKYIAQQEPSYVSTSFGRPSHSGGYVGVFTRLDGTQKVALAPTGDIPGHFQESTFEVLHAPASSERLGHRVKYGDTVVLVDQHGKVWNNKSTDSIGWGHAVGLGSSKEFFQGYIRPKRRAVEGEMFVSFGKLGREGKEVLYGDHGVFIDIVDSHRNSTAYNYRLTNYKSTNSKCLGGYVCCHGYGHEMSISVHAANDSPGLHFLSPTTLLRNRSSLEHVAEAPRIEAVLVVREGKEDTMVRWPGYDTPFLVYTHIDQGESVVLRLNDGSKAVLDVAEMRKGKLRVVPLEEQAKDDRESSAHGKKRLRRLQVSWENVVPDAPELSNELDHRVDAAFYLSLALDACHLFICYTYVGLLLPFYFSGIRYSWRTVLLSVCVCWMYGLVTPRSLVNYKIHRTEKDLVQKSKWQMKVSVANDCFDGIGPKTDQPERNEPNENDESAESKVPARPCLWRTMGESSNGIPNHPAFQRFLKGEGGDKDAALSRWGTSMTWREELSVDSILLQPHRKFEVIKRYYPHYYLGRSKHNFPIYVEKPGMIDLDALKRAGVTAEDLLWHSVFLAEYQWAHIEPVEGSPSGKSISILDMNGIGFSDLAGDTIAFMRKTISIAQDHYPERSKSIYVINVPYWFDIVMKIVRQFISPATLEKIHIFRYGFQTKMLEEVDEHVLPKLYGGTSTVPDDETNLEIRLRKLVYQYLVDAQLTLIDEQGDAKAESLEEMTKYLQVHSGV